MITDLDVVGFKSIRFSTKFTLSKSGLHYFSYRRMSAAKVHINDALIFDQAE